MLQRIAQNFQAAGVTYKITETPTATFIIILN